MSHNNAIVSSSQLPERVKAAIGLVKNRRDEAFIATYSKFKIVGHGSFGAVFLAQQKIDPLPGDSIVNPIDSTSLVAIKMVYQDRRYKNEQDIYLFLVLEYLPETLFYLSQTLQKNRRIIPIEDLRVNRPIAKLLIKGEPNVSYICSRYYRAPELLLASTNYSYAVDLWSAGCVMAELILNIPIFPGTNDLDQMLQIIRVLGSPSQEDLDAMNSSQMSFKFSTILPAQFSGDPLLVDFLSALLRYSPLKRISAVDALLHPFFESIHKEDYPPLEHDNLNQLKFNANLRKLELLGETGTLPQFIESPTPTQSRSSLTSGTPYPPVS
ncbi:glycogen synthase kinase-3 beta-like protein [Mitosporidium daphniae]|uniref:Glycogen synthase kinase-3 beta-like protein n=1 Tax=Mitosporidium daphniae TaxID=1485682 RepID=A0A098VNL0_9MICR|nr:glycogen synthase kinase-3 beta-like protein [Mitosporidium daphniae]KGG50643.1 glycogen synthase kinase-3 beta-like protein [Mitosporidium daphniae]|eukprot:XP_013237070.1 glycogen synthase kinase-3 beta-like protein [Mitosporidium daphniae]